MIGAQRWPSLEPRRRFAARLRRVGADLIPLLLLAPLLCGFDLFRSSNTNVEEGNAKLGAGKLKEALAYYEKAAKELPDEPGVHYNLGIALYQLGQFDRARQELLKGTAATDAGLKEKSFYNLGNVLFEQKKFKEAVAAYTRALQLSPGHVAAKWNLELALRRQQEEEKKKKEEEKKKKEEEKKKEKKDGKQQKDGQQKDDKGQAGKQPEPKKDQGKQQQGKKQQKQDPRRANKQQPRPRPDQQQMNDVLNALDRSDRNLQRQRARAMMGQGVPRPVKDW
jgi:Ca-activated chloride channel homolog